MDQRVWVSVWLYCVKQLSPELREKCFVTADPAGAKPHTFRVTYTHRPMCVLTQHTHTPTQIHCTYKICIPRGGWVSVTLILNVSWGLYNKCLAEFCQIRSHRAGIYLSPEQAWLETLFPSSSPESASSCLPPMDSVTPVCFLCLSPDMRSTATGADLAIGNIGEGIAGHLGYCHRKHLISYCLNLKPLP